ncbi:RNA polymerase sigma factor [Pedobacter sp. GR22-6]|uniref:RNA polymerase sigma factor n=1 Tax=Pedobacter sp. GR22-6 TaxID=3127957 RepID=UPI00307EEA5C
MDNYKDLADDVLLDLLTSGDHLAYKQIYQRYWAVLYRHARRMISDEEEAKDLIQDLFTNLWYKADELKIETSLSSYLYGTVRYQVFGLIDKRKVRQQHITSLQKFMKEAEFTTDTTVRENELKRLIEREISMLPPKMREVFELSRKSQLNHREISQQMDISDQTVKKQIYNAVKILRLKFSGIGVFLFFFLQ